MNITKAQAIRNAAVIALLFLVGACVRLGNIQQTEPIRSSGFTGSAKTVAQCIQQRLGGKVQEESFANRFIVYDAVKGDERDYGITHYSVTVSQIDPNQGVAALRVVTPRFDSTSRVAGPVSLTAEAKQNAMIKKYWVPVADCAAQAKRAS